MNESIVKDPAILSKKSAPIDFKKDKAFLKLLINKMTATVYEHKDDCVGLAAPQVGVLSKVVAVYFEDKLDFYVNPTIVGHSTTTYMVEEGCMSIDDTHIVKRYHWVKVIYRDRKGNIHMETFSGRIAQILQHEIDHLNGTSLPSVMAPTPRCPMF